MRNPQQNLTRSEALRLYTIGGAWLTLEEGRKGSIEVGKDADLVLWSDHPLSNFARAEKTYVDGRAYFDREEDRALQAQIATDRERIVQKALAERSKTLALDAEQEKKDDAKDQAPAAGADWFVEHAAERGLYHNGADLMSCGQHDHAH